MNAPSRARSLPWRRGLPVGHLEADDAVPHRSCLSPPAPAPNDPNSERPWPTSSPATPSSSTSPTASQKGWTLHQLRHSAACTLPSTARTAPELQAKSRHQHLASLGRYVQLGEQTSGPRSPPMPTQPLAANLADPMTGGHPHRTVLVDADRIHGRRHLPAPFAARPAEGSRCDTALAGPPVGVWSSPEDAGRVAVDLGEEVVDVR